MIIERPYRIAPATLRRAYRVRCSVPGCWHQLERDTRAALVDALVELGWSPAEEGDGVRCPECGPDGDL